jgi:hypothetical protein
MTRGRLQTVALALATSFFLFTGTSQAQKPATPAGASSQEVPAEYQAGIAKLRSAKGYLEKAGDKWCGDRIKAIYSIDKAFKAFGVSPESTKNEMSTGNVDEPTMMNNGLQNLQAAKSDFERAGNGWGGRKVNGITHVSEALQYLQEGIACAKQHKTY